MITYIRSLYNLFKAFYYSRISFLNPEKALQSFNEVDPRMIRPKQRLLYIEILRDNGNVELALKQIEKYGNDLKSIADSHYVKGLLLTEVDNNEEATFAYNQAIKMNPKIGMYWNALATSFMNLGKLEDAISAFKQGLKHDDKDSTYSTWHLIGDAYMDLEDFESAKDAFERTLINKQKIIPRYYVRLADAYRYLGEEEKAINLIKKAIKLHDTLEEKKDHGQRYYLYRKLGADFFELYRNEAVEQYNYRYPLFLLLKEQGKKEEALAVISQAINTFKEDSWIVVQLGNYYRELNNNKMAIEQYNVAIALNPSEGDAYYHLGETLLELNEFKEAVQLYTNAIEQFPDDDFFYNERHKAYVGLGEFKKALLDMNVVIKNNPNEQAFYDRGYIYFQMHDFEEAHSDLQQVKAFDENAEKDLDFRYALGNVYLSMQLYELAEESFTYCLEHDHENKLTLYERRAECFLELEQYGSALQDCNKGLMIADDYSPLLWIRGLVNIKLERPFHAKVDAERYIEVEIDNPTGYYNLGLVLEELNDQEEAIDAYSKAVVLDERYAHAYYRRAYLYNERWEKQNVIEDLYHWLIFIDNYHLSTSEKILLLEEQTWVDSDIINEVRGKFEIIFGNSNILLS